MKNVLGDFLKLFGYMTIATCVGAIFIEKLDTQSYWYGIAVGMFCYLLLDFKILGGKNNAR